MLHLRQSPRLKNFDYLGHHAYFVTSVTRQRRPSFTDPQVLDLATDCLQRAGTERGFDLIAYCFMPDHVHILANGQAGESNLREFIRTFKQRSGFQAKRLTGSELWQISYHDRVLRKTEAVGDVARYIWANPLRANLVKDYREWPGSGPTPLPELR
jgi:putative transposase